MAEGNTEPFSMELRCRSAGERQLWVSLHCGRFVDPASERNGLIYQLHDITSRRLAEGELHHIAYHDSLTDLANRNCFNERLEVAVERTRLDDSQRFAVVLSLIHNSEPTRPHQISYAVFCLKKKKKKQHNTVIYNT